MSKRKREENRADVIVKMVADAEQGNPENLVNELDAIVAFLRTWERDYGKEDEPRLAMITGMVADLATILAVQASFRGRAVSAG